MMGRDKLNAKRYGDDTKALDEEAYLVRLLDAFYTDEALRRQWDTDSRSLGGSEPHPLLFGGYLYR